MKQTFSWQSCRDTKQKQIQRDQMLISFQKASWRISVDSKLNRRNKAAFSNFSRVASVDGANQTTNWSRLGRSRDFLILKTSLSAYLINVFQIAFGTYTKAALFSWFLSVMVQWGWRGRWKNISSKPSCSFLCEKTDGFYEKVLVRAQGCRTCCFVFKVSRSWLLILVHFGVWNASSIWKFCFAVKECLSLNRN